MEYESGRYELYLHQGDRQPVSSDCFANLTWAAVLGEILQPFTVDRVTRYLHRTAAQLYNQ